MRSMRMCQGILKAMHSRPDDNFVAYRKVLLPLFLPLLQRMDCFLIILTVPKNDSFPFLMLPVGM